MECQTGDDRTVQWVLGTSWDLMGPHVFFLQVSAIAELHPLVVDFAEDPLGSKASELSECWPNIYQ